jgi:hypothetical protein
LYHYGNRGFHNARPKALGCEGRNKEYGKKGDVGKMILDFGYAEKSFGDFMLKALLTDDPEELDVFWTRFGEVKDVFVTHSLKTRILVMYGIEEPLGNTCPFCGEELKYREIAFKQGGQSQKILPLRGLPRMIYSLTSYRKT